jgi:hypothetical protein
MVLAQALPPIRKLAANFIQHHQAGLQLHMVALAVVKGNGFHPLVLRQGARQTGGGVLPAGKKHQSGAVVAVFRSGCD